MENMSIENEQKNSNDCKPYYCKHHNNIPRGFIIPTFIISLLCLIATVINLGLNLNHKCDRQKCMMPMMNPGFSQNYNSGFGNGYGNSFGRGQGNMPGRDFSNGFGRNFGNNIDSNNQNSNNTTRDNNNNTDGTNKRPPESKGPIVQNENVSPEQNREQNRENNKRNDNNRDNVIKDGGRE